jgi:hypothetical protein
MSEFVTHILVSLAMGEWKQLKAMSHDSETAPDLIPDEVIQRYSPTNSSVRDILEQPAKEPLFVS